MAWLYLTWGIASTCRLALTDCFLVLGGPDFGLAGGRTPKSTGGARGLASGNRPHWRRARLRIKWRVWRTREQTATGMETIASAELRFGDAGYFVYVALDIAQRPRGSVAKFGGGSDAP
jgi:hypothetical protein